MDHASDAVWLWQMDRSRREADESIVLLDEQQKETSRLQHTSEMELEKVSVCLCVCVQKRACSRSARWNWRKCVWERQRVYVYACSMSVCLWLSGNRSTARQQDGAGESVCECEEERECVCLCLCVCAHAYMCVHAHECGARINQRNCVKYSSKGKWRKWVCGMWMRFQQGNITTWSQRQWVDETGKGLVQGRMTEQALCGSFSSFFALVLHRWLCKIRCVRVCAWVFDDWNKLTWLFKPLCEKIWAVSGSHF